MKFNLIKNNRGFTMIETLVAVTILMISIAGPLTIAQKSLAAAIYAKDQVTASYLAQKKIEEIRNDRDMYFIAHGYSGNLNNWVTKYMIGCDALSGGVCGTPPSGGWPEIIDSTVYYNKFTIKYKIVNVPSSNIETVATVSVIWRNGTISNITTLKDHLFEVVL